jgi:hypothetical protein
MTPLPLSCQNTCSCTPQLGVRVRGGLLVCRLRHSLLQLHRAPRQAIHMRHKLDNTPYHPIIQPIAYNREGMSCAAAVLLQQH